MNRETRRDLARLHRDLEWIRAEIIRHDVQVETPEGFAYLYRKFRENCVDLDAVKQRIEAKK